MKNCKILILAIVVLFPVSVHSQVSFSAFGGFATYKMAQLKEFNEVIKETLPFDVGTVDNFKPGFYFGASAQAVPFSNLLFGLRYQFNTTGSRIGTKDYSGYYSFDQIVNGHLIGIEPGVIMTETAKYRLTLTIMSGALFTNIKSKETLSISGEKEESSENLSAFSIPVYPSLTLSIPVIDLISVCFSAGYLIDTGGKVHLKGNSNAVLMTGENIVKTGWNGLRINAGLKLNLISRQTNQF
jgi:hypothetical protein